MRHRNIRVTLAVAALLFPALANAQPATPEGRATLDLLLGEVRLLRQAIERQSATGARAQLLIGRLALQDQRLARSRATADSADREVTAAAQQGARMQTEVAELQQAMEETTDPDRRNAMAAELRLGKARLADQGAVTSELQARQTQAKQAMDVESARYDEIEAWFSRLERELDKTTR